MKNSITALFCFICLVSNLHQIQAQQSVTWVDATGLTFSGSTITSTAANGWNSGAASIEYLQSGTDGWVETTVNTSDTYRALGLSAANIDDNINSMDFAFYFSGVNNRLLIWESGSEKLAINQGYANGDKLKIERVGTQINYLKNDSLLYASTAPSTSQLYVDISFNVNGSSLADIVASNNFDVNHQSSSTQNVTWTDQAGISFIDNKIIKNAPAGFGNSGAVSVDLLPPTTNGWVKTTIFEDNTMRAIGLSATNTDNLASSIDYAIVFSNTPNRVLIHENGTERLALNGFAFAQNEFKVERVGTEIRYLKDNTVFYTSTIPSTSALKVDIAFNTENSTLMDVTVSSSFTGGSSGSSTPGGYWSQDGNTVYYDNPVAIGRNAPLNNHLLSVQGSIASQSVQVTMTGWADFVFEEGYELRDLKELKTFIDKNGHLPDIPSTQEVLENGIALGEMNKKLLQKIEELTLYLLQQQARIEALEKKLDDN